MVFPPSLPAKFCPWVYHLSLSIIFAPAHITMIYTQNQLYYCNIRLGVGQQILVCNYIDISVYRYLYRWKYDYNSCVSCCIIVKNTIVHQYSLICMPGKNDQSIDFGNRITYTSLRPNIHVVDNNFHQQCVTYSRYCGKLELLNVYFFVLLNHILHRTVIELSLRRYNVLLPILQ